MGEKGKYMIPVFSLERQNKKIGKEVSAAIKEVIERGVFILGPKVEEFERQFAKYIGVKYAVGVASGTDALSLSLLAVGVGPGDEVVLPANSYPTAFAVTAIGAIPKLVDIDPITFNIDPSKISVAITKKTKAVIAVHLYGGPADMERIYNILINGSCHSPAPKSPAKGTPILGLPELAPPVSKIKVTNPKIKTQRIYIIEDCAQAHGAEIKLKTQNSLAWPPGQAKLKTTTQSLKLWKKVGSIGDVGCFSFYPTKNLGCFGDGGMVVTDNKSIADKVRMLRMYGEKDRYKSVLLGRNSRLDEIQAAILLIKLKYLDEWNERRRNIAELYKSQIHNSKLKSFNFQLNTRHIYHLFVIRTKKRDQLKKYLEEKGIGTAIHYPIPIHLGPAFAYLGYKKGDFPESEKASREILSLPMWPELKNQEIKYIAKSLVGFFK